MYSPRAAPHKLRGSVPMASTLPKGPLHILVDSTGVEVYGEGEWKVRQHGVSKRRTWLKMHLAIDAEMQEVIASVVSDASVSDDEAFADRMNKIEAKIASVSGDGAYDKGNVRETVEQRGAVMQNRNRSKQHRLCDRLPLINAMKPSTASAIYRKQKPKATYPKHENSGDRKWVITSAQRPKPPYTAIKRSSALLSAPEHSIIRPVKSFSTSPP